MSALRLFYSVLGSLFVRWTFFVCTITSFVSRWFRVLILQSVTRSDRRFTLATGSPVGTSPFCFSLPLRVLLCCFVRLWSDVPCFSSLALYPESSPFFPLFAWIRSALSIGGCRSLHLFCVFLFVRPSWLFCCLCLSCPLPFFHFLHGVLCSFLFLVRGFSLPGISSLILLCLHTWSLRVSFFLSWFWPFPLGSSLSPLCVLTVLLVSTLGLSFAYSFLVPLSSFLFLSLSLCLVFLVISCGFFLRFLLCLFFGWVSSLVFAISLLLTLAVSFHSRSLFACPCSPVRSFSRASYLFFPFGLFSFLIQGFLFASCCGSAFCLPVAKFNVPLFIVIGLVLFSFCYLVRFPSLSAGSESLGGSSHS